jgi:hypothetical protein
MRAHLESSLRKFQALQAVPYFLATAIFFRVLGDLFYGRFQIHNQTFWPARYSGFLPLGSIGALLAEWLLLLATATMLAFGPSKFRVWVARFGTLVVGYSLCQFFQNQKLLILFVMIALSYDPLREGSISHRNLRFLIYTAYLSAALHKILYGFYSGVALTLALKSVVAMGPQISPLDYRPALAQTLLEAGLVKPLSIFTVLSQVALPILLWKRPNQGILAVAAFHLGLSVVMPDILPFGFSMLAAAMCCARSTPNKKENPA